MASLPTGILSRLAGPAVLAAGFLLPAGVSPVSAALSEVTGLNLPDTQTLAWGALAGTAGYHVYRGDVGSLSAGGYGHCLRGSVQGTSTSIPDDPPAGTAYFYLVAGFDPSGQGSLGTSSHGDPRLPATACVPARRYFRLRANGDPGDGVEDGVEPRRNPSVLASSGGTGDGGVILHTGEFTLEAVDLTVRGRGIDWVLARRYRSQIDYDGPLGHGWDLRDQARLEQEGSGRIAFLDGAGRRELFDGLMGVWRSPPGQYAVLLGNPGGSFTLRHPDGLMLVFHGFDGSNEAGALESMEDRLGNRLSYLYDSEGLLRTVVDTMGRTFTYTYGADGRIASVADFSGRTVVFTYDAAGDLVAVRSPLVTGTPNGNDFPAGKTTLYTYSSSPDQPALAHNMLDVVPAGGVAVVRNSYGESPGEFSFDRVTGQVIGGTNASGVPAGGSLSYAFEALNPGGDRGDPDLPRRRVTVVDRNGNEKILTHNAAGNRIGEVHRTNRELRPGEPDYLTLRWFSAEGELLQVILPSGASTSYRYDVLGADRYRQGNLVEVRREADAARGDGHGGFAADLVWTFGYEPVFNQLQWATDPRGNDPAYVPPNGGAQSSARYTTTWIYDYQEGDPILNGIALYAGRFGIWLSGVALDLGDVNGDGLTGQTFGNWLVETEPAVALDPASRQAAIEGDQLQEIQSRREHDDLGQMAAVVDAEGNRHEFSYYPETDPDGDGVATPPPPDGRPLDPSTGGYLATRRLDVASGAGRNNRTDPPPSAVREDFSYDPEGRLTSWVDGRGVKTSYLFNALDQLVETRRAAATATEGTGGDPPTGRGETDLQALGYRTWYAYDLDDRLEEKKVEDAGGTRGLGPFITTRYVHDLLGDVVQVEQPAGPAGTLVTQLRYDANQNRIRVTHLPLGRAYERAYDERDLPLSETLGGLSTWSLDYDGDGNPIQMTDPRGHPIQIAYDGHDRPARRTDQVGGTLELWHDPIGVVSRELWRGNAGGPVGAPGGPGADLADVHSRHDEQGRLFRIDRTLFVPAGGNPERVPHLEEGGLLPGDGFVSTVYEHDRLSRPTFVVKDSLATTRTDYDGLGRAIKETDPAGDITEKTWDAGGNLIETAEREFSSTPGPPEELFLTTWFYDALDRMTMAVDNLGGAWRRAYDSLDALVLQSDANGPPAGAIHRRSAGRSGMTVAINGHGNVARQSWDGADRPLISSQVLTATGQGDGTTSPAPDTSNPYNPDGLITLALAWNANSQIEARTDDRGNTVRYAYDAAGRVIQVRADDGTARSIEYDAAGNPLRVTDANGTVATHMHDDANRLVLVQVTRAAGVEGTTEESFEYDGLSRLTRARDNNDPLDPGDDASVRLVYDSLGRVIEERQTLTGSGDALVDAWWGAEDLMTALVYPSGRRVDYGYDAAERMVSVGDAAAGASASYEYFGLSRPHTRGYGIGIRSTWLDDSGTEDIGYDGAGRTTLLRHRDQPTVSDYAGFEYTYDRTGNQLSERRLHEGGSPVCEGELYRYDSAGRLTGFQEAPLTANQEIAGPMSDEQLFTLDGAGNWSVMARNGVLYRSTPNNNNEYDDPQSSDTRVDDGVPDDFLDQAATPWPDGLNLTHDKNGDETGTGVHEIHYDFLDRPVRAVRLSDGQTVARYAHDPLGRRVRREVTNSGDLDQLRRYLYHPSVAPAALDGAFHTSLISPGAVVEEQDGLGQVTRQPAYGAGERLWSVEPGAIGSWEVSYTVGDPFGRVAAKIERTGASTAVTGRVTYDPYGKPTFEDAGSQPLRDPFGRFVALWPEGDMDLYPGFLRYDPELGRRAADQNSDLGGFYLEGWRWYNPNEGRYAVRQGWDPSDDPRGGWNPYAFANHAPARLIYRRFDINKATPWKHHD